VEKAGVQFRTRLVPPPADLAGLVNTFYVIETGPGRVEETIPAYSAQLILMVRGHIDFTFADGRSARSSTVTVNAPQMRSASCKLEGPVLQIGASLTHVAWQKLANLPADRVHDQLVPAHAILTAPQIAALEAAAADCKAGKTAPEDLCRHLGEVVADGPFVPRADHVAVVEAILRWLASDFEPRLEVLYGSVALSPRQVQRICRRFFGVAPAQVLKRFRAVRATILLARPDISDEVRSQLLATYFDQAHLIRDIRRYTGRTPTQWRKSSLASGLLDPAAHGEAGALLRKPTG
jgi:AraC-like DNA-binding protein